MTRDEILAMEAGPELDALVAEKVMGYSGKITVFAWQDRGKRLLPLTGFQAGEHTDFCTYVDGEGKKIEGHVYFPRRYSWNILDAWRVVEKTGKKTAFIITRHLDGTYCAEVNTGKVFGKEAPEATCKAALLTEVD